MNNRRKILLILSFLILNAETLIASQRLLILHSYSFGCRWTGNIQKGILEELNRDDPDLHISVEYMDSQFLYDSEFSRNIYSVLRKKYGGIRFDGIIVSDDNALDFIVDHGDELFPDVPVVACGVNVLNWRYVYSSVDAFILEKPDAEGCIEEMKHVFPELESLDFIYSAENPLLKFNFETLNKKQDPGEMVGVRVYNNGLSPGIIEELSAAEQENRAIFLSPHSAPGNREIFQGNHFEKQLSALCDVPIFVSWDCQLGSGVLGGRVIDSVQIGRQAVKCMLQIFNGENAIRFLSSYEGMYKSVYDYNVMKRLGIPGNRLPEGAEVINKPPSFFYRYRYAIPLVLLLIIYLVNFFRSWSRDLKKQKIICRQNQEIIGLREEYIETQMELIETLGELIEKRSRETSSHVRRVAHISALLAGKCGMEESQIKMLEAASPMHDVGKIGVPDEILQKEGPLTNDEFDIIKRHTIEGAEILSCSHQPLFETACTIALSHHENWDGSGYPFGLTGASIPVEARITRIVDVFDALLSERPYKKAWRFNDVLVYMKLERGRLFDPDLLDLFVDNINEIIEVFWSLEEPEYYENLALWRKLKSPHPVGEPI